MSLQDAQRRVDDLADQRLELGVAGDEIGLGVDLDRDADATDLLDRLLADARRSGAWIANSSSAASGTRSAISAFVARTGETASGSHGNAIPASRNPSA